MNIPLTHTERTLKKYKIDVAHKSAKFILTERNNRSPLNLSGVPADDNQLYTLEQINNWTTTIVNQTY